MSHYRKIDVRIWNDQKFLSLTERGKLAFLMLLTHPMMTALGAMRGTPAGLAAELGTDAEVFAEAFRDILANGMAEYDGKTCLIALPKFLKYNPPESPNVVRSWAKVLDFLPECALKTVVMQRAVAFAKDLSKGFAEALPQDLLLSESREQRAESREQRAQQAKPREKTFRDKRRPETVDIDGMVSLGPDDWQGDD